MPHGVAGGHPLVSLETIEVVQGGCRILSVSHWEFALEGVTALVGPNGSGKSTLLRVLHGLMPARSGRITWPGRQVPHRAILLQNPVLLRRSAAANIDFVLKQRVVAVGTGQAIRLARNGDVQTFVYWVVGLPGQTAIAPYK